MAGKDTSSSANKKPAGRDYFNSYEDLTVHELMLKDKPRTLAYKQFIEDNAHMFKDKVVVDVGAGTGILSLFAAKAGAKKVYAIEASGMSQACEAVADYNGYGEVITVIHGAVEDVDLPENTHADILISEWMGFYLLHESMLSSIITARDKWLSPDGIVLPSSATLYLCPVSMKTYWHEHFNFWNNVYGFDFAPLLPKIQQVAFSRPAITTLDPRQCVADAQMVVHYDLQYVAAEDISSVKRSIDFEIKKPDLFHGFACWFDVEFEGDKSITLSTGPEAAETHWKQTVVLLPAALLVNREDIISCNLELTQDTDNPRLYNICIELVDDDDDEDDDNEGEVEAVLNDIDQEAKTLIMQALMKNNHETGQHNDTS